MTTRKVVFAGIVGALYAALTIALSFIGYGPVQFRVAEALCILPFFLPVSVWGLFVGCIAANLLSPYPLDLVIGPIATLLAALCTFRLGQNREGRLPFRRALACLPPVLFNAVFIGAMLAFSITGTGSAGAFWTSFLTNALQVGFGELAVMYILGLPLMVILPKTRIFSIINRSKV